jgi:hypothetical protein
VVPEWVDGVEFDFGSARATVVRDRPGLSYRGVGPQNERPEVTQPGVDIRVPRGSAIQGCT